MGSATEIRAFYEDQLRQTVFHLDQERRACQFMDPFNTPNFKEECGKLRERAWLPKGPWE
jgi:hypothetical protein